MNNVGMEKVVAVQRQKKNFIFVNESQISRLNVNSVLILSLGYVFHVSSCLFMCLGPLLNNHDHNVTHEVSSDRLRVTSLDGIRV